MEPSKTTGSAAPSEDALDHPVAERGRAGKADEQAESEKSRTHDDQRRRADGYSQQRADDKQADAAARSQPVNKQ